MFEMLKARVIPCLLLKDGGLVKTKQFKKPVYVGDPINAIRIFNDKEVDELVLLDISSCVDKREPDYKLIEKIAGECFMPLAYGGGIKTVEQIQQLLRLGVEKVVLNTSLHTSPDFVMEAVNRFGSQAITASIDVKKTFFGRYVVAVQGGRKVLNIDPVEFAKGTESLGIGEILLTSIDREGMMNGYDIDLIKSVASSVSVPVIASGGAGILSHFRDAIVGGHASAVSAGSMFVFYGPHRAVLVSYPSYASLTELFS